MLKTLVVGLVASIACQTAQASGYLFVFHGKPLVAKPGYPALAQAKKLVLTFSAPTLPSPNTCMSLPTLVNFTDGHDTLALLTAEGYKGSGWTANVCAGKVGTKIISSGFAIGYTQPNGPQQLNFWFTTNINQPSGREYVELEHSNGTQVTFLGLDVATGIGTWSVKAN